MAPFPVYDTEVIEDLKKQIERTMGVKKIDYDAMPVHYCAHCKSLHIEIDEANNDVCGRCGSVNEVETAKTIEDYNKKFGNIWE